MTSRRWLAIALFLLPVVASADPLPRVAVIAEVRVDGKASDSTPLLDAVNAALLKAGFPLVAEDRLKAVRQTIDIEGALNGKLPTELSALDVDLIVIARGSADELHGALTEGHPTKFFGSKVTATVVRADTAAIAAAPSANGHAADLSETSAAEKSLEHAVDKLAPDLITALRSLANSEHSVELAVHGITDRASVRQIEQKWEAAGLPALQERYFGLGLARFELTTKDSGQSLANKIDGEQLPLEIIATSQTRIAARFSSTHGAQIGALFTAPQAPGNEPGWLSDTIGELVYTSLSQLGFLRLSRVPVEGSAARLLEHNQKGKAAEALLQGSAARAVVLTQLIAERDNGLRLNVSVLGRHGETLAFATARGSKTDPASVTSEALKALEPALTARAGAADLNTAPRLRVVAGNVQDLFPAQVNRYSQHPAAQLTLHADGSLAFSDVRIQVMLPGLMALPTEVQVGTLKPGEDKVVPLPLALDPAALAQLDESRATGLQVTTQYRVDGMDGSESRVLPVVVHGRHAIDWREPQAVAAFVTAQDPQVRDFATQAVAASAGAGLPGRISAAAAIHSALTTLPLRYVKDPDAAWGSTPLDSVELPRETLATRSGDCDDLSVLYSALLESVGVPTSFLLTPGHILVAFDTGLPESRRASLSVDAARTLAHDGTLWVPVETTIVAGNFEQAWAAGAREAAGPKTDWVPVRGSWAEYPPTALTAKVEAPTLQPAQVAKAARGSAQALGQARSVELARWVEKLDREARRHPKDEAVRAQLVAALALSGKADEAVRAAGQSHDPRVNLDRGNALLLSGHADQALAAYAIADSLGGRARFNEGLANQQLGHADQAAVDFADAVQGGLADDVTTLLGGRGEATRAADAAAPDADVRKLLEQALAKAPAAPKKDVPKTKDTLPSAARRGANAAEKLDVSELLYWEL